MEKEKIGNQQIAEMYDSKKEQEISPELAKVAESIVNCYGYDPKKESFLVITDTQVMEKNTEFIVAIEKELKKRTSEDRRAAGNYEIITVPASPTSATPFGEVVGEKMKDRPVLIATSMSRSHSAETGAASRGDIAQKEQYDRIIQSDKFRQTVQRGHSIITPERLQVLREQAEMPAGDNEEDYYSKLGELAKKTRSRIISITKGHNPFEILTKGAAEESPETLRQRGEAVMELMKDVKSAHITTDDGTDLVLRPWVDKTVNESGNLSKPGSLSNYPVGEWACSVIWKGANGTLVVDGPFGGKRKEDGRWHNLDWVKEAGPFKLTIEEGEIVEINGKSVIEQRTNPDNELIASFIAYLDSGNDEKNHGYKLAEFAVGTNGKACEGKPDEYWGSTETEKKYGTCHIAVGSNGTFGVKKDDSNFNPAKIHCDMVLLDRPTIECEKKNGESFFLLEKGEPQGY